MNIILHKLENYIILEYFPENPEFLWKKFGLIKTENVEDIEEGSSYDIKSVFLVDKDLYQISKSKITKEEDGELYFDELQDNPENFYFVIAELENDFYKFDKKILKINFDLYIQKDIPVFANLFHKKSFKNESVFRPFNEFYNQKSLHILKNRSKADINNKNITIGELRFLIQNIPNNTELLKYTNSRYTAVLKNILDVDDVESKLGKYIKKIKNTEINNKATRDNSTNILEKEKYKIYLEKLKTMLKNVSQYEKDWQNEILKIYRIINPKYIYVGEKLHLKSFYDQSPRYTDIVLVDYDGNIDLMEIKVPMEKLFYEGEYRKNFIPTRELQGTCMQLQNYLISLQKTSNVELNNSNFKKSFVPDNISIKAIMPKGFIIFGLNKQMEQNNKMKNDFQILRNMYSNIIDIITYDDLIQRFENAINSLV